MTIHPFRCHRRAGLLAAALLVACGDDVPGPSQALLLGQWGSDSVGLVAIRAGAEVQLHCATVIIDEPIELNAAGDFSAIGRLQAAPLTPGALPEVRVSGRTTGAQVILTLPGLGESPPATYRLDAGVVPLPLEVPICPL